MKGGGDHVALGVLRYHSTNATADNAPVAESAASVGGLTLPSVIEQHIQRGDRGAYEYVSNVTGKAVSILNCFDVATPSSDGGPSTCVPVTALTTHVKWRHAFDALVESKPDEHHEVAFMNTRSRQYAHFTRVSPNLDEPTQPPKEAYTVGQGPTASGTPNSSSQEKYQCTRTRRLARMSTHSSSTSTQAATYKSLGTMSRAPRTQYTSTATSSSSQQSMRCARVRVQHVCHHLL